MRFTLLVCFCVLMLIKEDNASGTVRIPTVTHPTSDTSNAGFNAVEFTDSITGATTVWIVDPANIAATDNACKFPYSPAVAGDIVTIATIGFTGGDSITVNNVPSSCFFVVTQNPITYTVTLVTRVSSTETNNLDTKWTLILTATLPAANYFPIGVSAFPTLLSTVSTPVNYNPSLSILDKDGNAVTFLKLGASAFFRFTMTISNYFQYIDDAGARLTTCIMSESSDFTSSVVIIDSNGCFTSVLDKNNDEGFTGSASISGSTRTFTADTPKFPVINFVINNVTAASKELHFMCNVFYCDDGTDTTPGNCGGPHCSPTLRKKRESRDSRSVTTSVRIVEDEEKEADQGDQSEKCTDSCSMNVGYKAAVGGLSGLAIILLGGMFCSYGSVMKVYAERKEKAGSNAMSTIAKSTSGKTGTMSVADSHISVRKPSSHVSSRVSNIGESKKVYKYK